MTKKLAIALLAALLLAATWLIQARNQATGPPPAPAGINRDAHKARPDDKNRRNRISNSAFQPALNLLSACFVWDLEIEMWDLGRSQNQE